jgi:hypothetical protein
MSAEIKTLRFYEGVPVQAPDTAQPLTIGNAVNANHAIRKDQAEAYAQGVADDAENNAIASANSYTDSEILALINGAPLALDTLKELADALGSDANFSTTVMTALSNRLRVDTNAQGLSGTEKTNAKTNIDLHLVDNTSDSTKNSATAILTNKTFDKLVSQETVDATTTGANANITTATKTLHKLTLNTLVSVDSIDPINGMFLVLQNKTGVVVTINNNLGTVGKRILTGIGANLPLAVDACLFLIYSPDTAIWQVVGGSGSGSSGASGGVTLDWSENSDNAPLTEYVDGFKFKSFDKESSQEIYSIVTIPTGYVLGTQIKLKRGQFFNASTSGNVKFKTETTLVKNDTVLGAYPNKHNSTNAEVTVNAVSNTINSIGEIDLTDATGLINGQAVNVGMKLLIKLFRDNANETSSALADARLLIDNFEITFS